MNKKFSIVFLLSLFLPFATSAQVQPSVDLVNAFISASEKTRQPDMKKEDLEGYLAFMSDDVVDYHAAYGRTFSGKEHFRKGIVKKSAAMISMVETIESIVLGSNTAVVVVNEDSKYHKNGAIKHFKGRTILVLEFNEQGLISQMRRYLD
jgi:ketosteroid isomerase-like protein